MFMDKAILKTIALNKLEWIRSKDKIENMVRRNCLSPSDHRLTLAVLRQNPFDGNNLGLSESSQVECGLSEMLKQRVE